MLYERRLGKCPSSMWHNPRMDLVGNYPIAFAKESNHCGPHRSHAGVVVARNGETSVADRQPIHGKSWQGFSMSCARAVSGMLPRTSMARARPYTATFSPRPEPESSTGCGRPGWPSTTSGKAYNGSGKPPMQRSRKPHEVERRLERTQLREPNGGPSAVCWWKARGSLSPSKWAPHKVMR